MPCPESKIPVYLLFEFTHQSYDPNFRRIFIFEMRRESVANLPTIVSIITEMDVFVPSPGIALFAKLILILATSKLKARHRVFQVLVDMEEMSWATWYGVHQGSRQDARG